MALVTDPTYPVAGEAVELSATATTLATTFVFELVSVPSASALATGLLLTGIASDATPTTSPLAAALAEQQATTITPDVAGEYVLRIYELTERTARPRFARDAIGPGDARFELSAVQDVTMHVGATLELPLVTAAGSGAVLALTVVDETVRALALVDHTDEQARQCAIISGVTSALGAAVGSSVATIMGDFVARAEALRIELQSSGGHYALAGGWHRAMDATNPVTYGVTTDPVAAIAVVNACRISLEGHLRDRTLAASPWHHNDDMVNWPIARDARTVGEAQVLLADLRERVYERHRVLNNASSPTVHDNAAGDTTNALAAPTLFDSIVVAYFDALAAVTATAPAGEPEGAADALAAGFSVGATRSVESGDIVPV